jgi:hypothetical protein
MTTYEIIKAIHQVVANAADHPYGGTPTGVLEREKGHRIHDSRIIDGFSVRIGGEVLTLSYSSEVNIKDAHENGFEDEIKRKITGLVKFLKREYKTLTNNELSLTAIDEEPQILLQSISYKRTTVRATCQYKLKLTEPLKDDGKKEKLDSYDKLDSMLSEQWTPELQWNKFLNEEKSIINRVRLTEAVEFVDSGEAEVVYNSKNFRVVVPKTEEAACHFGRGTAWCTSSKTSNMFSDYSDRGPLYIVWDHKEKARYQLQFETGLAVNAADQTIDIEQFLSQRPELQSVLGDKLQSKEGRLTEKKKSAFLAPGERQEPLESNWMDDEPNWPKGDPVPKSRLKKRGSMDAFDRPGSGKPRQAALEPDWLQRLEDEPLEEEDGGGDTGSDSGDYFNPDEQTRSKDGALGLQQISKKRSKSVPTDKQHWNWK